MWQETIQPSISIAWQQGAVVLGCCFLLAVLIQSSAFKGILRELRIAPWRSLLVFAIAVLWFTVQGTTKAPDVVEKMMRLLFWDPASPWQLQMPHDAAESAKEDVTAATNVMAMAEAAVTNAEIYTISFDWHSPNRLPYHYRQNVMGYVAAVIPTNIAGILYEDHYVSFNATASTNPAIITIEYAQTLDDGTAERYSANVTTNSYPDTHIVELQSGSYTCFWFRCAVPAAVTNCVRDWNGEALFGGPVGSDTGFDVLGTLVVDDGDNVWVGATTNMVIGTGTNIVRNGFITED